MANDWGAEVKAKEAQLAEAKAALAKFQASEEGKRLAEAQAASEAALKAAEAAREGFYGARRERSAALGISGGDDDDRYSDEFLAAAAKEIGATREEAEGMTGLPSHHGSRVTGQELYDAVLSTIESCILDHDAVVLAAEKAYDEAKAKAKAAREAVQRLEAKHAEVLHGESTAQLRLNRAMRERTETLQRREAARGKREARRPATAEAKALADRLASAKARLLALDKRHRDERSYGGSVTRKAEPVEWWPPKVRLVRAK